MLAKVCGISWIAILLAGCNAPSYVCSDDTSCRDRGATGLCESTGFCSFPDDSCPSGRRYGDLADVGFAMQCVEGDGAGQPASGGTSMDSTSNGVADPSGWSASEADEGLEGGTDPEPPGSEATSLSTSANPETSEEGTSAGTGEPHLLRFGEHPDADVSGVTRDAFLRASAPEANTGAHYHIHVAADEHAMIEFDVSAIPFGSTVLESSLVLVVCEDSGSRQMVQLQELLEPWEEGFGNYDEVGAANWMERDVGTPWSSAGAGEPGSSGPVFGSFEIDGSEQYYVSLAPHVVQGWIDDPQRNHGVILRGSGDQSWFGGPDGDPLCRPMLEVVYFE